MSPLPLNGIFLFLVQSLPPVKSPAFFGLSLVANALFFQPLQNPLLFLTHHHYPFSSMPIPSHTDRIGYSFQRSPKSSKFISSSLLFLSILLLSLHIQFFSQFLSYTSADTMSCSCTIWPTLHNSDIFVHTFSKKAFFH